MVPVWKRATRGAHIPTMPNVRTKIPVVEVIAPDGQKSLWVAAVAKGKGCGSCKTGNSSELLGHAHKATANDYPEVGNTPARRSAEGHAMTHPKRPFHSLPIKHHRGRGSPLRAE
jgi:hypothetical protein